VIPGNLDVMFGLIRNQTMKHGYGNLGAVPVPGTAEVRVQPGYRCMRTPGVPHFFQKKKFQVRVRYGSGTGWVRAGYGQG
jgi:hypothetical protein